MTNEKVFLSPRETAEFLGIGLTSLYGLVRNPSACFPKPSRFGPCWRTHELTRFGRAELTRLEE